MRGAPTRRASAASCRGSAGCGADALALRQTPRCGRASPTRQRGGHGRSKLPRAMPSNARLVPLRGIAVLGPFALALPAQVPPRLVELHRMLPTSAVVRQAALGDVDGDGARDIVLIGGTRNSVWRSAGGGRFEVVSNALPSGPAIVDSTVLADLDGDGDLDLAAAIPATCNSNGPGCSGGSEAVLWNDGTGHFVAPGPV